MLDIKRRKALLRAELKHVRALIAPAQHKDWSRKACGNMLRCLDFTGDPVTGIFWPIGGEIDTRPLIAQLQEHGCRLALPHTKGPNTALEFRLHQAGDVLERAKFGVMEPPLGAPIVQPEQIIVPLLGFDDRLYRIGYGGGFYDRTIANLTTSGLPIRTFGFGFECQIVDELPLEATDLPLDLIVSEQKIRTGSPS